MANSLRLCRSRSLRFYHLYESFRATRLFRIGPLASSQLSSRSTTSPPFFNETVRCLPSALMTHPETAGIHDLIPQKSPIFFHTASGGMEDLTVTVDSSANADAVETEVDPIGWTEIGGPRESPAVFPVPLPIRGDV